MRDRATLTERSPYDDPALAETYHRLAARIHFEAPARDLVAAVRVRAAHRVLDVGTGTGAAAAAAALVAGPAGFVVGVDASLAMLRRVASRESVRLAAARAPALPFRAASFDAATASFVLSHVRDPAGMLVSIVRVLRVNGRVGVTAWASVVTPVSLLWSDVVARVADPNPLRRLARAIIPWERLFCSKPQLRAVLRAAGLRNISISRRTYAITLTAAEYLSVREASIEGVLLRRSLSRAKWNRFRRDLSDSFGRQFGESITYTRDVHIAVGVKHAE